MKILSFFLLLVSFATFAQTYPDPYLGLPIRWEIVLDDSAMSGGGAQATINFRGQRIILVSPRWASTVTNNIAGAVLHHEACHHTLGHTSATIFDEADADCCAARTLARAGLFEAVDEFTELLGNEGCNYDPRTPLRYVNRSHPCGTQRAQIVQQCANEFRAN